MTDPQAAREQIAREWLIAMGWCHLGASYQRVAVDGDVVALAALIASIEVRVLEEAAELVERRALICKTNSKSHLQDGVYTQARSWEGGWHECERIIGELRELAQERTP